MAQPCLFCDLLAIYGPKSPYTVIIVTWKSPGGRRVQMRREAPDTHFYAEIRDLNLEFLEPGGRRQALLPRTDLRAGRRRWWTRSAGSTRRSSKPWPPHPASWRALRRSRGARAVRIAEPPPAADPDWGAHARLFAAELLTYVLQMAAPRFVAGRAVRRLCGGRLAGRWRVTRPSATSAATRTARCSIWRPAFAARPASGQIW